METPDDVEAEKEVVLASFACGEMDVDIESGRPSRSWATIKRVLWAQEEHRAADKKKKKHLEELEELKAQCEALPVEACHVVQIYTAFHFSFLPHPSAYEATQNRGRTMLFIRI